MKPWFAALAEGVAAERINRSLTAKTRKIVKEWLAAHRQEASLLFRLVSGRYEKGAILITTNKAVKGWLEVLVGDEVMTTALPDWLLQRSHVINITGRSYRFRDLARLVQE